MADPGDARQAAGWDADSLREVRVRAEGVLDSPGAWPGAEDALARDVIALTKWAERADYFVRERKRLNESLMAERGLLLVRVQELTDRAEAAERRELAEASFSMKQAVKLGRAELRVQELTDELAKSITDEQYREWSQKWVDGTCHYRNLAIKLGAKPESMLSKYDRDLAERGSSDDEGGWTDDTPEVWDDLEQAELRVQEAERALRDAADTFEDFALGLRLIEHGTMAEAALIAEQAIRAVLGGDVQEQETP